MALTVKTKNGNLLINAECMRDFAGSFNVVKDGSTNGMIVYLIPTATLKAVEDLYKSFKISSEDEIRHVYRTILTIGFMSLLEDCSTRNCVIDFINGVRGPKEFSELEIASICDVFYINTAPPFIKEKALDMLK